MKSPWIAWCVVLLRTAVLPACSRDQPSAPGLHSISGHRRLTGYLVDVNGRFAGTRAVAPRDAAANPAPAYRRWGSAAPLSGAASASPARWK